MDNDRLSFSNEEMRTAIGVREWAIKIAVEYSDYCKTGVTIDWGDVLKKAAIVEEHILREVK